MSRSRGWLVAVLALGLTHVTHAKAPPVTDKERVLAQMLAGNCVQNGYFSTDTCAKVSLMPLGCGPEIFECPYSDVLGDPDKLEVTRTFYNFNGSAAHVDKLVVSAEDYWDRVRQEEQALAKPHYGSAPDLVHPDTRLNVTLPDPHPKQLAVKDPDGEWVYLIDAFLKYSSFPDLGKGDDTLSFTARDLQGIRFRDGKHTLTKVFTKRGTYRFYFADDLETEPENTFSLEYAVSYEP